MSTGLYDEEVAIHPAKIGTDHSVRDRILKGVRYLTGLYPLLVPPPPNTSTEDLIAVRHCLDPDATRPGSLFAILFRAAEQLQFHVGSSLGQIVQAAAAETQNGQTNLMRVIRESSLPQQWASDLCSGRKQDDVRSYVQELLKNVDAEIADRVLKGEGSDHFLATKLFGGRLGVLSLDDPLGRGEGKLSGDCAVGNLAALDASHSIRSWGFHYLSEAGPSIVLGPCRPRPVVGRAMPRPIYSVELCYHATRQLRIRQLQKRLEGSGYRLSVEEHAKIGGELERIEALRAPKFPKIVVPKVAEGTWAEELTSALEMWKNFSRWLTLGLHPETIPLEDLLIIRRLFDLNELAGDPSFDAAARFSGRFLSSASKQDYLDGLKSVVAGLEGKLCARLEQTAITSCILLEQKELHETL